MRKGAIVWFLSAANRLVQYYCRHPFRNQSYLIVLCRFRVCGSYRLTNTPSRCVWVSFPFISPGGFWGMACAGVLCSPNESGTCTGSWQWLAEQQLNEYRQGSSCSVKACLLAWWVWHGGKLGSQLLNSPLHILQWRQTVATSWYTMQVVSHTLVTQTSMFLCCVTACFHVLALHWASMTSHQSWWRSQDFVWLHQGLGCTFTYNCYPQYWFYLFDTAVKIPQFQMRYQHVPPCRNIDWPAHWFVSYYQQLSGCCSALPEGSW